MHRVAVIVMLVICCVTLAVSAEAFDGRRKGFMLGGGLGAGVSHVTQTGRIGSEDHLGMATEFKIGAGIDQRFQLYYVNRMNWFSDDRNYTFTSGVGLVGASYYMSESTSSMYVLGLVGVSSWRAPFDDLPAANGFGMGVGLGWEFARHYSVEATANYGSPGTNRQFTMVLVTLNALAY